MMETPVNAAPTIEWGSGDNVLVFLHYFGGAAMSWHWVATQMSGYRCVALNLPGFGGVPVLKQSSLQEYAHSICAEIERLCIKDYTLIGHSMGGKIALQVALTGDRSPERIVLIAPSPPTQEPMPATEKDRLLSHHPSKDNAETTLEKATRRSLTEEQRRVAIATQMAVDDLAWRWWLLEGMNHSIVEQMAQLNSRVTVLASKDDPVIPYDTIQRDVVETIPNVHLISTQGVGHLIPIEDADWVAMQLRAITPIGDR